MVTGCERAVDDVTAGSSRATRGLAAGRLLSEIAVNEVSDSWQRCVAQYHLDPNNSHAPQVLTQPELNRVREPLDGVLTLCREELDRLYALVRPAGYATVLAEPTGAIVERRCVDADANQFSEYGTRPGALWSEQLEGTNGIGTCIIEEHPINVHRDQHFRRRHVDLSCSGAPIFGPDGRLAAVLNVACYATEMSDRSHGLALAVTADWSRAIEERQFRERFRRQWTIALELDSGSGPASLLAVDSDQRIVGADRNARTAFALTDERLAAGVDLWAVFDRDPSALRRRGTEDVAIRLTQGSGAECWHGLVTPPAAAAGVWRSQTEAKLHTRPRIGLLASVREPTSLPPPRGGLSPSALRRVREHIEFNLEKSIRVDVLAAMAGLSVYHFARAFKQSVGVAPHHYLLQRRIEKAAQLLVSTNQRLSDIALAVGFSDQSHFAKHFSRLVGSTPSAFRRAQR